MKALAVLWTAGGKPQCLIDTGNDLRLEAHLEMLQRNFPESRARMAFVEVTESSDPDRETMPAPDPFSEEAFRKTPPTAEQLQAERELDEYLRKRADEIASGVRAEQPTLTEER